AAEALGNRLGGENEFIQQMNQKAQELKLSKKTNFTSASGLPTEKGESLATAKDLAILAEALVTDYPQVLEQTRAASWTLSTGGIIDSTNGLLTSNQHDFEVDGLKTGYTEDAGYCYIGTASKGEQRLLVIVLGTNNSEERFLKADKLLQKYFD
ncbi:MAG: D-alanyl-D-alanine carboxypeptidase, partial [Carnobacterium sp.]